MRALALVAFATLLLSATVSAALLHPRLAGKYTPRATHYEDASHKIFELMERFVDTVENRDYNRMAELLADDFSALVTPMSCEPVNKTQFLDMWHQTGLLSETATIKAWLEMSGVGLFEFDLVGQFGASRNNMSASQRGVFVTMAPSDDYKKIRVFQQLQDLSFKQANASAMVAAGAALLNASETNDIAAWEAALTPQSVLVLPKAWSTEEPQFLNRTESIAMLKHAFTLFSQKQTFVTRMFATCDMVFGEFDVAAIGAAQGKGYTNHFYTLTLLDPALRVLALEQVGTRALFEQR